MDSLSLKLLPSARGLSNRSTAGVDQVCPPSVERLASTALRGVSLSNEIEIACSVPVGPNETHGADARVAQNEPRGSAAGWYPPAWPLPPAQRLTFGALCDHVWPPSSLTPASRP